ncbi:MAG TPA: hypothetical protein VHG69_03840 [Thermoleophilaceae bacterium]|nr:hypothetical protein [Thermoleophilaceae bacterium]
MAQVSRRKFIQSSALAAGLAGLPLGTPVAGAAKSGGLSPARRRTFTALVATVAEANGTRFDAAYLRQAADGFDGWYAGAPRETRELVERTLDGVEGNGSQRFSGMSRRRRLAALHGWRHGRSRHAQGLAYDAVTLAGSPFGPPPFANASTMDL